MPPPPQIKKDMKKVFQGVELTEVQYTMLSWLATSAFNSETRKEPMLRGNVIAYENACRIVGVNTELVYAVSVHLIFTGLQNMNKLTGIVLWD